MNIAPELRYTRTHEWVRKEQDGTIAVGITHHAQELLGDMVFVENPAAGRRLAAGEECAVVESVKAASDVYSPVAGEVVAANVQAETSPQSINQDPYGTWMFKLRPADPSEVDRLLDAAAYRALVDSEAH
jgi:glycine cleavage system H protein